MGGWQVPTQPVEPRARKHWVAAQFCPYNAAQGVRYNASMSTEVSTSAGGSPAAGEESQTTTAAAGEGAKESGAPQTGEGGAGSKDAVLADLKAEREKRQALEAEIKASQDFRAKLTELLGGKPEQQDPAELARQAVAERDEARRLNAVYQAAPAGTDVAALLDSMSFRAGLAEAKDIAAYVAQVVKENPRYTISVGVSAAHNLNQGNGAQPPKPKSIDDLIRGR